MTAADSFAVSVLQYSNTPLIQYSISGNYNPISIHPSSFFESLDLVDKYQAQPRNIGNDSQGKQQDGDKGQTGQV